MNPEITKIIDQYIQGELSESDRLAFEKKLAESDVLKREVELQQTVYEGAKRAALRTKVQQAGKSYHLTKKLQVAGIAAVILATVAALTFYFSRTSGKFDHEITAEVKHLIEKLKAESPIENLQSEFFIWNGNDSVVLSRQGVLLSIPENAFLLHGQNYAKEAVIQWQEALDGATMMKSGLSTMSGDKLLETQGMFGFQAFTPEGEKLEVNPKIGVYVQVPVEEYKQGMQLFDGKKNKEGIIDWQNPKPLLKIPVPVDMTLLDFYPKDYEAELDKLKLRMDKKYRDSLYLSFEQNYDYTYNSELIEEFPVLKDSKFDAIAIMASSFGMGDSIPYDNPTLFRDNGFFYISPAKVLAFWDPKFNNTNLATREFEKRMRAIHATCDNKVLNKYVQQLSKPISEIDAEIVAMGYANFKDFAAEQLGAVNPDNPHLENLKNFYEKAVKQMQEEVYKNKSEWIKKQQKWDQEVNSERLKERSRTIQREDAAFEEEYQFNHKNVRKQLGYTVGFTLTSNVIVYNVDKFVMEATKARKTSTFYDERTGKMATITYNDFSLEVENAEAYEQIYTYLFPSMLNSYQRISGTNGKFSYPLNGDMLYDVAIVGISEKGYSFYQKKAINKGKMGKISLKNISEKQLNASIEQLNAGRIKEPMQIKDELNWLSKEQQNYKEQKLRLNQAMFRNRIARIIFPCYLEASGEAVPSVLENISL